MKLGVTAGPPISTVGGAAGAAAARPVFTSLDEKRTIFQSHWWLDAVADG